MLYHCLYCNNICYVLIFFYNLRKGTFKKKARTMEKIQKITKKKFKISYTICDHITGCLIYDFLSFINAKARISFVCMSEFVCVCIFGWFLLFMRLRLWQCFVSYGYKINQNVDQNAHQRTTIAPWSNRKR